MKIIAIEKESEKENIDNHAILKEEAAQVWNLYKEGIIREIYFTTKNNRAVLMLECKDENEVELYLNKLTLVMKKLIQFEIHLLKNYDGFERLFV